MQTGHDMDTIFQYIETNAGYMSGLFTIHATKGFTMTDKYNKYLWLCADGHGRDKYRNFAPVYTFAEWLSRQHPRVVE